VSCWCTKTYHVTSGCEKKKGVFKSTTEIGFVLVVEGGAGQYRRFRRYFTIIQLINFQRQVAFPAAGVMFPGATEALTASAAVGNGVWTPNTGCWGRGIFVT